jgi:hypothetical protein
MPAEIHRFQMPSPEEVALVGQPRLVTVSPQGVRFDYDLGMGLSYLHDRAGVVADVVIDDSGPWLFEWQGFDSNQPLTGVLAVKGIDPLSTQA